MTLFKTSGISIVRILGIQTTGFLGPMFTRASVLKVGYTSGIEHALSRN